jgi:AraC-like DNA-binding protein
MAEAPDVLAAAPARRRLSMDALSDLLRVLRFSGGVFLDATFRAPWCMDSQVTPEECAGVAAPGAGLVGFHYVLDGRMQVRLGNAAPQACARGDFILLCRNDLHRVGSDLGLPPLPPESVMHKPDRHELIRIDFGKSDGVVTHIVCGFLATTARAHPLLESLPPLLVAGMGGKPCAEWVDSSFRYAARAYAERQPGVQEILARLSELLFVEAVKDQIDRLTPEATGWLAALRDPPLARALTALHARVAHPWTTDQLAEEALLSRSTFAERFARTLGMPPMTYLTRWRMLSAAQRLRESPAPIARVAAEVGYESESTFSRAFAREMGMPPGRFRQVVLGEP